jgi:hypothetical protein
MKDLEKVIFLDIDGVLQPISSQKRFRYDLEQLRKDLADKFGDKEYLTLDKYDLGAIYYDWDKEAVSLLKQLCEKTDAKIVISSNWKDFSDSARLKKYFKIYELDDYVVDVTPSLSYPHGRESEIEQYLKENPNIKKFVIFDDSYVDRLSKKFPKEFIYCKYKLNKNEYDKALEILNS